MDDLFEEAQEEVRIWPNGWCELLEQASKIEDGATFIEYCILNKIFNEEAIVRGSRFELSEHDLFNPGGFDTWEQHQAFGRLVQLYIGAKAWHEYLMYEVQKYTKSDWQQDVPAIMNFLRRYEPKENLDER